MSKPEDKHLIGILENLDAEYTAICDFSTGKVRHTETMRGIDDAEMVSGFFYEGGWRMIGRKLCCPDCFKGRQERKAKK